MALVPYRPMIFQYFEILQYHWLSKVKQQFIVDWQQGFYDPCLASAATKYTAQWQMTTTEMTTEITTETNMETTTIIPLTDQDPMVLSSIQSRHLGHASVLQRRIRRQRRRRCGGGKIIGAVSNKCLGFCKWLRFSKSEFATFSNSTGHQKWPALSASDLRSMMAMVKTIKSILTLLITYIL